MLCIVVLPISLQCRVKLQAEQAEPAVAGTLRVTIHAGSMPQLAGPDFEELGSNSAKPGTLEQGQLFNIFSTCFQQFQDLNKIDQL